LRVTLLIIAEIRLLLLAIGETASGVRIAVVDDLHRSGQDCDRVADKKVREVHRVDFALLEKRASTLDVKLTKIMFSFNQKF
jgi:hypothetical protein